MKTSPAPYLDIRNKLSCNFHNSHCTFVTILFRPFARQFVNLAVCIKSTFLQICVPFLTCRTSTPEDAIFHRMELYHAAATYPFWPALLFLLYVSLEVFCHADQTVPRQDVNSTFTPPPQSVPHAHTRCLHTRIFGPSRVRRRLFPTCLGDPILDFRFWHELSSCTGLPVLVCAKKGLSWQQTFLMRVISLSPVRWFFSLLNEQR